MLGSISFSCQTKIETHQAFPNPTEAQVETPPPVVEPTSEPRNDSPIRKVDFGNFIYPETKGEEFGGLGPIELVDGKNTRTGALLSKIEYGDVTKDGIEEALVPVDPYSGGNTSADIVFVYTLVKNQPKLLWSLETGDRAEGGRKRVYAENGDFIVELFGDDKYEKDRWHYDIAEGKFNGLCCPTTFTRFHFRWNGRKFLLTGKPEVFDYDWKEHINGK